MLTTCPSFPWVSNNIRSELGGQSAISLVIGPDQFLLLLRVQGSLIELNSGRQLESTAE